MALLELVASIAAQLGQVPGGVQQLQGLRGVRGMQGLGHPLRGHQRTKELRGSHGLHEALVAVLQRAKGRRLGHSPLPGPLGAAAGRTFHC